MKRSIPWLLGLFLGAAAQAQINTGSNGSDGALDYTSLANLGYSTNIVINMADHPNGIYQYTYVNIPTNVTVSFIPNANNTPVYWLVQSNVVIKGTVDLSGQGGGNQGQGNPAGGLGGPGGFAGGLGGSTVTSGQGPGGGAAGTSDTVSSQYGGGGSYSYGSPFLIPLSGGSGGGGSLYGAGGGGGGGAILVVASNSISLNGALVARGGWGGYIWDPNYLHGGGGGSGGAIRLVASQIVGHGSANAIGGDSNGGGGRVRFDTYDNEFSGGVGGQFTSGSQFIIIPTSGQLPQLTVTSVGGVPVSASPTGLLSTPDAVLSAQQNNPIPIVVNCANLPLHSLITVSVKPANGAAVSATGYNDVGTQTSSTATISINIPRGGGLIYATAATGD